jgi:hypothetical protein
MIPIPIHNQWITELLEHRSFGAQIIWSFQPQMKSAVVLCVALHLPLIHCLLCEYPSVVACYCVATEALAAGPMCINSTGVGSRVERGFGSSYDCNGLTSYKCDSYGDRGWCCVELMKLSTAVTSSGGPQATTARTTARTTKHSITMTDSSSASFTAKRVHCDNCWDVDCNHSVCAAVRHGSCRHCCRGSGCFVGGSGNWCAGVVLSSHSQGCH